MSSFTNTDHQTAGMARLIRVFAVHIGDIFGYVMHWLIFTFNTFVLRMAKISQNFWPLLVQKT